MAVGDFTEYRNGAWALISKPVDPQPPGVVTLYGSSWGGATGEGGPNQASFDRLKFQWGGMDVARYFPDEGFLGAAPVWTSWPQYLRDSGAAIIYSWRGFTPAVVASGGANAQLQAHFASMPTDREIWSCYYHEVDTDINAGAFTLDDYWAACQAIKTLKDQYAPPNVHLTLILTSAPFIPSRTPPHPYDYFWDPAGSMEVIGADLYQHGTTTATFDSAATVTAGALEARDILGVPLIIPECGARNLTYATDAQRASYLSDFLALIDTKASAVCYFESFRGNLGPWNLTEEPLGQTYSPQAWAVWSAAVSGTTPPTEPAGETVVNKVLTSNVATLTTAGPHGLTVGSDADSVNGVTVAGVGSNFNGTYELTAVTSTTLSYSKTAADVPSQASSGGTAVAADIPVTPPPPPPPPPSGIYFGNSQVLFDQLQTTVSNPTGAKGAGINTGFSLRRTYDNWPTLFAGSAAGSDPGRGVMSHWSHTPGNNTFWTQVMINGSATQNQVIAFYNSWPQNHGGLIAWGHEPESQVQSGAYDVVDYRNAQRKLYQLFLASNINKDKVKFGIITTNEPFRAGTVKQYYPQLASGAVDFGAFDYVGVDYYRYWRPSVVPRDPALGSWGGAHPITYWADPVINFAQGHPIVVAEHASHPDPTNVNKRPSEFQGDINYWKANGCIAFDIYHSKLQPGHGPWWWDVLHCYGLYAPGEVGGGTPGNLGTGQAPWNTGPDDKSHPDPAMLTKLRQVLEAAPRYNQATFTGWGF